MLGTKGNAGSVLQMDGDESEFADPEPEPPRSPRGSVASSLTRGTEPFLGQNFITNRTLSHTEPPH